MLSPFNIPAVRVVAYPDFFTLNIFVDSVHLASAFLAHLILLLLFSEYPDYEVDRETAYQVANHEPTYHP